MGNKPSKMKTCTKCGVVKTEDQFRLRLGWKGKYRVISATCRVCEKEDYKSRYACTGKTGWKTRSQKYRREERRKEAIKEGKTYRTREERKTQTAERKRLFVEKQNKKFRFCYCCGEVKQAKDFPNRTRSRFCCSCRNNHTQDCIEYKKLICKQRVNNIRDRLNMRMRIAVRKALKGNKQGRRWESLVGYSVDALKSHLEKQFKDGMNWDNAGTGWHIDHIIPLAVFNYTQPEHPDFKRAWGLNNLQPLWALENKSKGTRIDQPFQPCMMINMLGPSGSIFFAGRRRPNKSVQ